MSGFQVRPFAFMRLTHEAIRVSRQRSVAQAASLRDDPNAEQLASLTTTVGDVARCIEIHASHEENGFFPLLDQNFERAASNAGFHTQHEDENARLAAMFKALNVASEQLDATTAAAVADAVDAWAEGNEVHLLHEEEIMMPLTREVAPTMEGRARAVRGIIDAGDREATESWQIPFVVTQLAAGRPFGPLRMYVAALRVIHGDDDFGRFAGGIRGSLDDETVGKLVSLDAMPA